MPFDNLHSLLIEFCEYKVSAYSRKNQENKQIFRV